jgi:phage/plasmid primase-like uncharacterized protein
MEDGGYNYIPLVKGENGKVLILGEGVESTLSVVQMFRDLHQESFSAISLVNRMGIECFRPSNTELQYWVYGDRDVSRDGQLACAKLVGRIKGSHDVKVMLPPEVGVDWNDVLKNIKYYNPDILFEQWL